MNWNIVELLPEEGNCRQSFNAVIAGYINAIYNRLAENKRVTHSVMASSQPSHGLIHNTDIEFTRELLSTEMSQTLFQ